MNKNLPKRIFTVAITLFLTSAFTAFAEKFEQREEHTFALPGAGKLVIDVSDVDIRIHGEKGLENAQVVVTKTTKKGSEEEAQKAFDVNIIECTQEGDLVKIKSVLPNRSFSVISFGDNARNVSIDIEVQFPEDAEVMVKTSDGDIALETISGQCDLNTSDGDVFATGTQGSLSAKSSDGDVVVKNVKGNVEMKTSDGDLSISDVEGDIDLKTSDGDISISGLKGSLQAKTSDGNIAASMDESPLSNCSLSTSDGNIRLTLANEVSVDLDIRVSDGDINIKHPSANISKLTKHSVSGRINQGGVMIRMVTSDGDITVGN